MTKEDLLELKEKISKLSESELKERDVYLRQLSSGELQGPPTGYASIDKPWLKYSTNDQIMMNFDSKSIYQMLYDSNNGKSDEYAINYFGNRIRFSKMFKKIDGVANSLIEMGIKKGDVVLMSLPNIPEAEYLFYALNKIGAVVDSIDPRANEETIKADIDEFSIKHVFSVDVIDSKIKNIVENSDVKVVSVSPFESLPLPLKILSNLKNKSNSIFTSWNDFYKNNTNKIVETVNFEKNETAVIVHTGGSTGTPKGVELTNDAFNGLIYQLLNNNMQFRRGQKFLNILPPFIALGLDNAMHLASCHGIESIMIPSFEPEDFPKLLKKYKPNVIMGGPIHFNIMINSDELKNDDLSYIEIMCAGGDKMKVEHQEKIQNFLVQHNAKANIWIGYGATECSSGISCMKDDCFRYESVGVPYLNNVVKVVDDNFDEVYGYNKSGELLISAPTMMKGYTGTHKYETNEVIVEDEFGKKWYRTGDIAHIDDDGLLFVDGRIKRIITRRGFKIYPQHVESLILSHPLVKECAVVGVEDPDEMYIPVANIVLEHGIQENEDLKNEIKEYINNTIIKTLPEYTVLAGFNFLDELPLTPIGKLDFKKLESIGILNSEEKILQKKFKI